MYTLWVIVGNYGGSVKNRFIGSFEYSIDSKGRVNVPSRFRKSLSEDSEDTFVVCYAPDNRLRAYPLDEWVHIEERYAKLPPTPKNINFLRAIHQTMSESTLDSQGRVTLTPQQMKYAKIDKKVALVGFSSEHCIELCGPELLVPEEEEDFTSLFYDALGDTNE